MKAEDILILTESIKNDWRIIKEDTEYSFGIAIRLTVDGYIQISQVEKTDKRISNLTDMFEIKKGSANETYNIQKSIFFPVSVYRKLFEEINELLDADIQIEKGE